MDDKKKKDVSAWNEPPKMETRFLEKATKKEDLKK